jgi:hypothetical protein
MAMFFRKVVQLYDGTEKRRASGNAHDQSIVGAKVDGWEVVSDNNRRLMYNKTNNVHQIEHDDSKWEILDVKTTKKVWELSV